MSNQQVLFNTKGNPDVEIWAEKYRPRDLDDYIGNDHITEKVSAYIEEGDIPQLMFYGKQGSGKTSLAKIIVDKIDCDYLYINASDENSVDNVRNEIKQFVATVSMDNNIKVVVLDEFDHMTRNAQAALRNIMETYVETSRFILTCNYPERVIEPIMSRTQSFKVSPPSKKTLARHLMRILRQEGVKFQTKDVAVLVKKYYPDIRKLINTADSMTKMRDGTRTLVVNHKSLIGSDFNMQLVRMLKSGASFKNIRQHVANNERREFADTYRALYDEVDQYTKSDQSAADAILTVSEAQYKDGMVVDKEINFMACIIKLLNLL